MEQCDSNNNTLAAGEVGLLHGWKYLVHNCITHLPRKDLNSNLKICIDNEMTKTLRIC